MRGKTCYAKDSAGGRWRPILCLLTNEISECLASVVNAIATHCHLASPPPIALDPGRLCHSSIAKIRTLSLFSTDFLQSPSPCDDRGLAEGRGFLLNPRQPLFRPISQRLAHPPSLFALLAFLLLLIVWSKSPDGGPAPPISTLSPCVLVTSVPWHT